MLVCADSDTFPAAGRLAFVAPLRLHALARA
jgi:hypothetical protein